MTFAAVPASPVPAYQNVVEFGWAWEFIARTEPASVLEIGSLFGGTLWYWSQLPTIERLVSVDQVTDYAPLRDDVLVARGQWAFWFAGVDFHSLTGNSRTTKMIDGARALGPFDVAFIDGDHSYDGVRADFEAYSPMVRPGGLVGFHDTIPNGDRHEPGVVRFVGELKARQPWVEFFDHDGVGICIFRLEG